MATTPFSNFLSILLPTRPQSSQFPSLPSQIPSQTPPPSSSLSFERKQQQRNEINSVDGCSSSASSELTAVMCPSLAYANTMYFRSAYNVQVVVEDNEPEERLLNRFRREVMRAGVIQEVKRRRFFENNQDELKRKSREAAKRNSRRRRPPFRTGGPPQARQESSSSNPTQKENDEDNWEMPDVAQDTPF